MIGYNVPMQRIWLIVLFFLCGCHGIVVPDNFTYQEIQTDTYKLASWQKITDSNALVRIYIEGDGNAFNHAGQPTSNPTPRGTFLRKIAFNDPNPNVVYLARPCQYVKDMRCQQRDWTTGRFSAQIVDATVQAIKDISNKRPLVLIGYSGGALLSGLVIEKYPKIPVKKWITIAGVLNHGKWTKELNLPPLKDSIDLKKLPTVSQMHLIGDKDKAVPATLTEKLVQSKNLIVIPGATHSRGYEPYYDLIYQ